VTINRYQGNFSVKHFNCLEQFRVMAFAQLTYRESLRDTVTCLRSQNSKLHRIGIRSKVSKSTLTDANEVRDWRIYADFAQHLIGIARKLYQKDQLVVDPEQTVSTTIDLCLSVFPWAHFRTAKAAVKLHTLIDLSGNIPTFIHISDGKLHDVNVQDILPSVYLMVAIIKKRLKIEASLYTILQILSVSVFERTELNQLLTFYNYKNSTAVKPKQLNLF
jgi:hypothetical protein